MANLSEIMSESFAASTHGTFRRVPQWAGLAIVTLILIGCFSLLTGFFELPVINLGSALGIVLLVVGILFLIYFNGIFSRILRRENKYFSRFGKTVWEGIKFTIVEILYTVIPVIVAVILLLGFTYGISLLNTPDQQFIYYAGIIAAIVIEVVIALFFILFWLPATLAFAKTGKMIKAFSFGTLDEMITSIGWKKFIGGYLILIGLNVLMLLILLVFSYLFAFIPVVGGVLSLVLFAIFFPYIWVYTGEFTSRLFEVNTNEN